MTHPTRNALTQVRCAGFKRGGDDKAPKQRRSPMNDPLMVEAIRKQELESARKAQNPDGGEVESTGTSRLQKIFGRRKKVSEEMPLLDVKGNRISYASSPDVS